MSERTSTPGSEQQTTSSTSTQSPRDALFAQLWEATDLQQILKTFGELCAEIGLDRAQYDGFYQSFRGSFNSWKAGALFQLLDSRAKQAEYDGQRACEGRRVLVVGAGPVGLRAAVEAALLGAKVDLVEKRDSFTRNNSLHLWPFLITDLKTLGAKKFYGRFCSSTIDHISIRILQGILLKACLILGVKVHTGVTFTRLNEPANANSGWTVSTTPTTCPITSYNFDIIIGADGKQNSLPGFHSKEFRAKLALAITANYVNSCSKQESSVPEISGVAYVYKQNFFNDLADKFGIELENIVYYKDETHYFVMTAKKNSLLKKGVLKKDHADPAMLLHKDNISRKFLEQYATEAVTYSTEGALGQLPFEKNHRGESDVALFDFTSLFASENAARIVERKGKKILLCVVGDSLVEPFWPTGSGCARGFLGAFDAAWLMKRYCRGDDPLEILEEREAILYLLPQTTPERLQKNHAAYSIDPKSRYMNLSEVIPPGDISHLYDTDDSDALKLSRNQSMARSSTRTTKDKKPAAESSAAPKHSSSSFALSSLSKPVAKKEDMRTEQPAETADKVKHFWQRKQETSGPEAAASRKPTQDTKSKPAKKENALSQSSVSQEKRHRSASPVVESSPPTTPKGKASELGGAASDKKAPSSPKWFQFRGKHKNQQQQQQRARSESPERSAKRDTHKDTKKNTEYPLEVTASTGGDAENPNVIEDSQTNVLDRIKQYNINDASVKGQGASGAGASVVQSKPQGRDGSKAVTKEGKGKDKHEGKSKGAEKVKDQEKGKKKEKTKDVAKGKTQDEKKKKDKDATSKHWNPFKKTPKAASESKSSKKSKKTKAAKDQKPASVSAQDDSSSAQLFSGVKNRIERLKEQGLMTDGTDGDDVVLLSVTQQQDGGEEEPRDETDYPGDSQEREEGEGEGEESDTSEEEDREEGEEEGEGEMEGDTDIRDEEVRSADVEIRITPSPDEEPVSPAVSTSLTPEGERGEGEGEAGASVDISVMDKVKKLQLMQRSPMAMKRPRSYTEVKRSKEIDLSELSPPSKPQESHPLWKARIIQGLNKCLEKLRKDNAIKSVKTTLEIINAIFSNVEQYPENDVFRRVRVSSGQFTSKVWQYGEASQFMARSGWVQIDDFIVLPMGTAVDTPMKVIEKHLNIVNQMLWSMQLEIPDSPSEVVKRNQSKPKKVRGRLFSLNKRESYVTMLVEESMERISEEDDRRAMAAATVRRNSLENQSVGEEKAGRTLSPVTSTGGLATLQEEEGQKDQERRQEEGQQEEGRQEEGRQEEGTDAPQVLKASNVPNRKQEEAQTIMAATAARRKWEARNEETKAKQKLETELYGLPPQKLAESIAKETRYVPSSYRRGLGTAAGIEDRIRLLSSASKQTSQDRAESGVVSEAGEDAAIPGAIFSIGARRKSASPDCSMNGGDRDVRSTSASPTPTQQEDSIDQPSHQSSSTAEKETSALSSASSTPPAPVLPDNPTTSTLPTATQSISSSTREDSSSAISPTNGSSVRTRSPSPQGDTDRTSSSLGESGSGRGPSPQPGNGMDQLKVLTAASRTSSAEKKEGMSVARTEKIDYEKITIEAAAITREKWKQTEELTGN